MQTMEKQQLVELAVQRQQALTLYEDLTDRLRAVILDAVTAGELSEYKAAELTGVSRTTVRAWLGK